MSRTQVSRLAAVIRPARTTDLPALGDFFAGLSVQARYLRFFSPITPSPALLKLLCGGGGTTDALLATRDGVIIGHGMAADRSGPGGTRVTDIGVVVADAWQGQGLGAALVRALITGAQVRGVTLVTMDVLHGNHRAHAMITDHWPVAGTHRSRDCETIDVSLAPGELDQSLGRPGRPGTGGRAWSGKPALDRRRVPAQIAVARIAEQGGEPVGLIVESQPVHGRQ
jgi:GNAT superfamily N-acetyltransferase